MAICQIRSRIAMNATGRSQIFRADNLNVCSCLVAVTLGGFLMRQKSACAKSGNERTLSCTLGKGCQNVIHQKGDNCLHLRLESVELLFGQPDTTAVAVLVTAEKSTAKTQRIELASAPRSSRRILSSHPQRPAEKRQFLAGFGILLHAIDARSQKRKQDAQEKPNCQSDKHD